MNELEQAKQQGSLIAKVDMILNQVSEINKTLHGRRFLHIKRFDK